MTQTSTSSGRVPVPLQVSPIRASCAASVAGLAEASNGGGPSGMRVEVAVEQFNSFVSGGVPTSCDMDSKQGTKPVYGQDHVIIRRGEKKKQTNLGQVLAGSPPVMKFNEAEIHNEGDLSKENYIVKGADGAEQEMNLQIGLSGKVISDSSGDLYRNGDRSHFRNSSAEPSGTAASVGNSGKKPVMAVTGNNIKGKSHARLGLGVDVDVGAKVSPQVNGDGDQVGNEDMADFGKKRLKTTSKLKQGHASVVVSASRITTK